MLIVWATFLIFEVLETVHVVSGIFFNKIFGKK